MGSIGRVDSEHWKFLWWMPSAAFAGRANKVSCYIEAGLISGGYWNNPTATEEKDQGEQTDLRHLIG